MNTLEAVSYHHMATGYVRDRWNRRDRNSPMLLAKCCHDLDVIAWLMSGVDPARVASFGSLKQFRPENAPAGSGARCTVDCRIERECAYSARRLYIEKKRWQGYVWQPLQGRGEVTEAMKLAHLAESPYGRCVWRCDNDVVDHQSVLIEFADGTTATHDMFCATARPTRQIHIIGTAGEIQGDMEDGIIRLRRPNLDPVPDDCVEEVINVNQEVGADGAGHGGGDVRLIADFVSVLRGESPSISTTRIEDSLNGHLIAFAADAAMLERRTVEIGGSR
jgi:predicted dehydrogenase